MAREKCWKCKKVKVGVKLRACDDRLCEDCYEMNEAELRKIRLGDNTERPVTSLGAVRQNVKSDHSNTQPAKTRRAASRAASGSVDTDDSDADQGEICSTCLTSVHRGSECLKCDVCSQKVHTDCTAVPPEAHKALADYVAVLGYVCDDCRQSMRASFHHLRGTVSILTDELATLRAELSNLKKAVEIQRTSDTKQLCSEIKEHNDRSETSNATSAPKQPTPPADIATIVCQTLKDNERRKCNIVVTGLPEEAGVDDRTQFLELCETHLSQKPHVTDRACIRLGKTVHDRPRRLLVRLSSEATAQELLRSAKKLRTCDDETVSKTVYINADLSPSEAKLAYEQRQKRRAKQQNNLSSTRRTVNEQQTSDDITDEQPMNSPTSFRAA